VSTELRGPQVKLRPVLGAVGVICLVLLSLRTVAEPMRVSSNSMQPTYSTGDEILVQKFGAHAREPARGDIVVVHSPLSGGLMIKRVTALGGQTVGIADGVLRVDGHVVPEPYIDRAQVGGTYFGRSGRSPSTPSSDGSCSGCGLRDAAAAGPPALGRLTEDALRVRLRLHAAGRPSPERSGSPCCGERAPSRLLLRHPPSPRGGMSHARVPVAGAYRRDRHRPGSQ
jgi:signal peptidase I